MFKDVPLVSSDYRRSVAKETFLPLVNRYVEQNPSLNDSQVSVISRPGLRKFAEVGDGPARAVYSSAGAFNDDLFVVSGAELYRVSSIDLSSRFLGQIATQPIGDVSFAATSPIGTEVPSYLFIAEGGVLWVYLENGAARGTLNTSTPGPLNNDTIEIGGVYYQWTNGSVNAGTPNGSSGNPWLVALGSTTPQALGNMFNALNYTGEPGTTYSTALTGPHPSVFASTLTNTALTVEARVVGIGGNGITTTETGANISWSGATLANGGNEQLSQVRTPDDAGAISVSYINSFVIVVPVQDDSIGTTGTFYWIEPGERRVDPLNFANAERSPDKINQVITYGDMFWLFGDTTTEPWVTTGNQNAPMQRFQGILFDRGAIEGTAVKVRDSMMVVDEEGGAFIINNGQRRVSFPAIEERIRTQIGEQI